VHSRCNGELPLSFRPPPAPRHHYRRLVIPITSSGRGIRTRSQRTSINSANTALLCAKIWCLREASAVIYAHDTNSSCSLGHALCSLSPFSVVLPSFAEGLTVVLMEAMALRRPIVSTNLAGIPELVIPGENGWLFAVGSVEELAAAMRSCLSKTPEELLKMDDAAYERVIARRSIETEASKLAELFRVPSSAA
jgi:Glycosyl transferases group 1